jgi:hypothetical protein
MGIHTPPSTAESWAAGTMVLLMSATANFSVGPVVYTIVSEIPSTRLRAKSVILARNAYNAINIAFVNVVSYRQLNPAEWNWGPKAAFFWAAINLAWNTWIWFRLREYLFPTCFPYCVLHSFGWHSHIRCIAQNIYHDSGSGLLTSYSRNPGTHVRRTRYPFREQGTGAEICPHQD